ncbi:MAG TPA: hypothetical protein VNA25_23890 [Phycisphaerae bacterium]|nr:hypothetical protein [Phycisphaerae bacterium]
MCPTRVKQTSRGRRANAKRERRGAVETDTHTVAFRQHPKYGFSVAISDKGRFITTLSLERRQAKAFAPHLAKAVKMATFVEQRIRP